MRLRKVKNASNILSESDYFIQNPENYKGKWNTIFNNNNKIEVEIGCGKGKFITGMAKEFPNTNFIAIEKFDSVLVRCLELVIEEQPSNVKLLLLDALTLNDIFDKNEISNIYLNFSDPWPKTRHSKRRLTSTQHLEIYQNILKEDGSIIQKTDNRLLFEFSLEEFSTNNWLVSNISLDLHKTDRFNITTEFEEKWSKLGPIYRLEAKKKL
ncbi:MAG: tRNA (guanosine(46)-N7)-methyltransferase TrmB [Anaeroplasmataceae bacterium]